MQMVIGCIYAATVVSIKNFGAFIRLEDGTQGMVHISQVSNEYVKDIADYLKVGQQVQARLIKSDVEGKLNFSLKQPKPENILQQEKPVGSDFEKMLSKFKTQSDEKIGEYNRSRQVKRNNSKRR